MKYPPAKKERNTYTLAETIAEIVKARSLGDVVCGQIGDIRYNSADDLADSDINRMCQQIMNDLRMIEIQFKSLEKKARQFHEGAPVPRNADKEQVETIRGSMWDGLYNLVNFTGAKIDDKGKFPNGI
jgi:hypothetical protein